MSHLYAPFGGAAGGWSRRALGPWKVQAQEETPAPAVFLVHHQNLFGPIHAMAYLPREVRLWVLSPFCDRRACFEQYYGYTFTQRFGWPKPAAWAVSRLLSLLLPGFLRQFRVIPVWRGSLDIRDTLRQSQQALARGAVSAHLSGPGLRQHRGAGGAAVQRLPPPGAALLQGHRTPPALCPPVLPEVGQNSGHGPGIVLYRRKVLPAGAGRAGPGADPGHE